ncbi:3-deoxy-manno-octulosonate cytidylyltransferase [Hyphomicrobium sp. ghe19]|nr:3-deoxy-manno-octulosonate cytidylyltransferase [Hyphomicrobium sp. ghe19]
MRYISSSTPQAHRRFLNVDSDIVAICHRTKELNAVAQETLILIPARMQATRLPGKPLADIHGKPMIVHVWRRAVEANAGRVIVATDSAEILQAVKAAGGEAVMTRADHASGSDRIHEAVTKVDPARKAEIIVNLQGDLPTLDPRLVLDCVAPLASGETDIATLAALISDDEERLNPNVVKVVGTPIGENRLRALYFTRATAPHGEGPHFHHIGIYAYRRDSLERFVGLPPAVLEKREKLEQLRALEAQMRIDVAIVDTVPLGVDTPADLERARRLIAP